MTVLSGFAELTCTEKRGGVIAAIVRLHVQGGCLRTAIRHQNGRSHFDPHVARHARNPRRCPPLKGKRCRQDQDQPDTHGGNVLQFLHRNATGGAQGGGQAKDDARHPEKSHSQLRKGVEVKFAYEAKHRKAWSVNLMCEALSVHQGSFCVWLTRPRSRRNSTCVLRIQMRQSFLHSDLIYVARREWHDMLEQAQALRMHRIVRLMRKKALHVRPRPRGLPKDRGERSATGLRSNSLSPSKPTDG